MNVKSGKHVCEKDNYFCTHVFSDFNIHINIWNLATCSCENGKYVGSITDNAVIRCDEIVYATKTVPTNFNE